MAERIKERLVTATVGVQEAARYHVSGPKQQRFLVGWQELKPESRPIGGDGPEDCRVVQVLLAFPRFEHDIGHPFAQLVRESRHASAATSLHGLAGRCPGHHTTKAPIGSLLSYLVR